MKVSLNILKEFVDINISPRDLADKLTMAGLEVGVIKNVGKDISGVVIAEVLSVDPHPNADKLTYCKVSTGKQELNIVCGAKNIKAGDKVPLAVSGATLPGGVKIKDTSIRGAESQGMMCSEVELGLGDDKSGILILEADASVGDDFKKALGIDDVILDIDLTPNRGDCLSVLGIAREVSAILDVPLKLPDSPIRESARKASDIAAIEIQEPALCSRYSSRIIEGVKIAPSPLSLQYRLKSMDIRPINNIVDITNLVLLELGHPLHAFDYDLIKGKKIVVRCAQKNEKIKTLDEVQRKLDETVLVIADEKDPVALAGIMGGFESSVTESTKNVLLESAYFNPMSIRRSAKKLDLATEASYRFERGVDMNNLVVALARTTSLIQEYCGGEVAKGMIDVYPSKLKSSQILFRPQRSNKVLGIEVPNQEAEAILKRLGFEISYQVSGSKEVLCREDMLPESIVVTVPAHRNDITEEIDLIEEVARIYGYDKIRAAKPYWQPPEQALDTEALIEKKMKDALVNKGFYEVINFSFMNEEVLDRLQLPVSDPRRKYVSIENPLSAEMGLMRSTLLGSIIENISRNKRYNIDNIKIFEVSRVFIPKKGDVLPVEKNMIAGSICGQEEASGWSKKPQNVDFFYLSGIIEVILGLCGISRGSGKSGAYVLERSKEPMYHPGRSADVKMDGKCVGSFGELTQNVLDAFDIADPVYTFELDLNAILKRVSLSKTYTPLSKYPAVTRDIAFLLESDVSSRDIVELIKKKGGEFLRDVKLFDVYKGEQVKSGYKSMAYSLVYQSNQRTLTDEEVNKVHAEIADQLQKKLGAQIRDK
ncbi:MAG: phenylalanine--tRNA ligase subunit beta [bacterium]